ncbi:copper homeostasis protein cutC homolog [Fopius arisanus]|uniref:Copper homeostasis protein cutC homolog n=1 Tax=Fopius arisanus TaxID=64838 RepID=A0A9R1TD03_9HYME|nr:PREDICTED: copper homeostasis protein cutC homolog [Fopius arisanus]XP_011307970.1 PREDICTED: copper homeostasis protein cutC homolog [Fopius arisanus]
MEICVDSLQSAHNAVKGGATRLEVCSSLSDGGLTPTSGLVHTIKSQYSKISLYCMIRIKPGNFVYTREEMDAMLFDVKILSQNGADGFVFGALTENYEIHNDFCREIISTAAPKRITFHRAFDEVLSPFVALEELITLGFERILTSGQKNTAIDGLDLIQKLVQVAGNRIVVMPGSGINSTNILEIQKISGAKEFHASAKMRITEKCAENKVKMSERESFLFVASEDLVKQLVVAIRTAR